MASSAATCCDVLRQTASVHAQAVRKSTLQQSDHSISWRRAICLRVARVAASNSLDGGASMHESSLDGTGDGFCEPLLLGQQLKAVIQDGRGRAEGLALIP